jgi:5-methyltetrahydropteroyltriglutamate--homocysteine methyltransferase
MIQTHVLGYPRVGPQREWKFAIEAYWRGECDETALLALRDALTAAHWQAQQAAGLDWVTVGDFAAYDHMAQLIQWLGAEPGRFGFAGTSELQRHFAMARGTPGQPPLEMTKWFDTNYHYLVPEFTAGQSFAAQPQALLADVARAREAGHAVKVVLPGPISFLRLGKSAQPGFDRLSLLDALLPAYAALLAELKAAGVAWVQLDEPVLALDLPADWRAAFEPAYSQLAAVAPRILLANYFGPLQDNLDLACRLPVAGLHVDLLRGRDEWLSVADRLPAHKILSAGLIDGRNIWRNDLSASLTLAEKLHEKRGDALWLATSCSLLHVPYDLTAETALAPDLQGWLAFARQKLDELSLLAQGLRAGRAAISSALAASDAAQRSRRDSPRIHDPRVAARLADGPSSQRSSPFIVRQRAQAARLNLPRLPTTTIGSFPQTPEIRAARAAHRRGELPTAEYHAQMQAEISRVIREQERLGLDMLVHGEAERNDMVEYFGEQLTGYAFTQYGWVQSYGSRCVKPPVIYGDVSRAAAMTVTWTAYAQSLSTRPVKGMLTGPVTMLQWAFVRDDLPRAAVARQIALAIRDEVLDLEAAGVAAIQIDEPAFREGLPLRQRDWPAYLDWAGEAFRLSASGVRDDTQIHTHMCYSEFNDILPAIAALDADVISIETSRSNMELLDGFGEYAYPNEVGPGIWDIHSPRVPTVDEMQALLGKALRSVPAERLWVNPDCGLKTRGWPETRAALANLVAAAERVRSNLPPS